jgi:hypothetical protein
MIHVHKAVQRGDWTAEGDSSAGVCTKKPMEARRCLAHGGASHGPQAIVGSAVQRSRPQRRLQRRNLTWHLLPAHQTWHLPRYLPQPWTTDGLSSIDVCTICSLYNSSIHSTMLAFLSPIANRQSLILLHTLSSIHQPAPSAFVLPTVPLSLLLLASPRDGQSGGPLIQYNSIVYRIPVCRAWSTCSALYGFRSLKLRLALNLSHRHGPSMLGRC